MISTEALEQFKKLWREEFGGELSDQVALDYATNLLTFFNNVYKPIKKEWDQ